MGSDIFEASVNFAKMAAIFLFIPMVTPLLVWVERRGSAFIQNRFGPNRVGPLGLTQLAADAVKFIGKEEFIPSKSRWFLFYASPVLSLIPAALALAAIPLSAPINIETFSMFGENWGPYRFAFQGFEIGAGIVFVLGVSSLAAYALLTAGWASFSKYSLFGALRACAQTISYELALGLSLVGVLIIFGTFNFSEMVAIQSQVLNFNWLGQEVVVDALPNWGIFYQPLGALILFAAMFAETNRLPFDLPEAEAELVAGYHTEYGGLKMNMFYIGEYGHMIVASALMAVFYFGGWDLWLPGIGQITTNDVNEYLLYSGLSVNLAAVATSFIFFGVLLSKVLLFLWIFVWVRWSLPRFRYDQLMDLGWKTMLPWALGNTIVTAILVYLMATGLS